MKRLKLFFWVIFFQIFILNNIQFSGYINPYYYIIFILTISNKNSGSIILLLSFLLGLTIDVFSNSYGAHAFSSVLIGYLKIKWIDKKYISDADDMFEFSHFSMDRFIINSFIIILIHHFSLFFLERFSFNEFFSVLSITLISSIFTLILFIIHKVCSPKKS